MAVPRTLPLMPYFPLGFESMIEPPSSGQVGSRRAHRGDGREPHLVVVD
jgi:hypothetical protein